MPSANSLRILICHSCPIVSAGIESIVRTDPGLAVIGRADSVQGALREMVCLQPALAIVELELPCVGGMQIVDSISRQGLPIRTVLISDGWRGNDVYAAMTMGAGGCVITGATKENLLKALRGASEGKLMLCEAALQALHDHVLQRAHADHTAPKIASAPLLTVRELQVLRCIAEGISLTGTGRRLHMSVSTVKNHRHSLFAKLGVSNAPAAVYVAVCSGLLTTGCDRKAS